MAMTNECSYLVLNEYAATGLLLGGIQVSHNQNPHDPPLSSASLALNMVVAASRTPAHTHISLERMP